MKVLYTLTTSIFLLPSLANADSSLSLCPKNLSSSTTSCLICKNKPQLCATACGSTMYYEGIELLSLCEQDWGCICVPTP